MRFVKAWNGKWHLLERTVGVHPAEPVGDWNAVEKPARPMVITGCGLQAFARKFADELPLVRWTPICDNCRTIISTRVEVRH